MIEITPQELLKSGIALVAMPLGRKGPTKKNWNCPDHVIRYPAKYDFHKVNVGLAHAYCTPNPTAALDVDNYHHAKSWLASHNIDLDVLLQSNDAVVIHSGKELSLKLLFRLPFECKPLESKKINGPDDSSALEFRCATKDGKTVQDVLPPSTHPNGHQYRWIGKGNPTRIPEIPTPLLQVWLKLISTDKNVTVHRKTSSSGPPQRQETPRQIAILKDALCYISADCDYETWRNIVWAILSTGWLCSEDLALEWSETAPERFDLEAFWVLVNSYISDYQNQITVGTIWHHARLGGWNV